MGVFSSSSVAGRLTVELAIGIGSDALCCSRARGAGGWGRVRGRLALLWGAGSTASNAARSVAVEKDVGIRVPLLDSQSPSELTELVDCEVADSLASSPVVELNEQLCGEDDVEEEEGWSSVGDMDKAAPKRWLCSSCTCCCCCPWLEGERGTSGSSEWLGGWLSAPIGCDLVACTPWWPVPSSMA